MKGSGFIWQEFIPLVGYIFLLGFRRVVDRPFALALVWQNGILAGLVVFVVTMILDRTRG